MLSTHAVAMSKRKVQNWTEATFQILAGGEFDRSKTAQAGAKRAVMSLCYSC